MKKLILIAILFVAFSGFSQELYTFKKGGRITQNGNIILPEKVREILFNNQSALNLYEAGRNKKTIGNILLWGGFATLIGKFAYDINYSSKIISTSTSSYPTGYYGNVGYIYNYEYEKPPSKALYILGGAMIILAIPIKIGFSNKIKQAVVLMNQDLKNPKTTLIESSDIIVNSDGIGVSIKF